MTDLLRLTLWQPWCQFMVIRDPVTGRLVKVIETRGWRAPASAIGKRVLIHAAKRDAEWGSFGAYECEPWWRGEDLRHVADCCCDEAAVSPECGRRSKWRSVLTKDGALFAELPLGKVVGSGTLAACVPITDTHGDAASDHVFAMGNHLLRWHGGGMMSDAVVIDDQLPYGDFTPGRWAWLFEDVKPTTERCPRCWGKRMGTPKPASTPMEPWVTPAPAFARYCATCHGAGVCDPASMKGTQGLRAVKDTDWPT